MILKAFNDASGLKAHHAAITNIPGSTDRVIEFDGIEAGKRYHIASGPFTGDIEKMARWLGVLQKNQILEKVEAQIMPVTGNLASTIRDRIEKAKAKTAATHARISGALDELDSAGSQADELAKSLEAEAADLRAALGLTSNGPEK